MTNQSLTLEFGSTVSGSSMDPSDGSIDSPDAEVDDVQRVEPEIAEIVMDGIDQLLTRKRMKPGLVRAPASADFGDDHQSIGIGMKRLLDDLIGHMRTVIVAGIDMVHAGRNRLSQNSDRGVKITRRSPTCGPASCIAPPLRRSTGRTVCAPC